ncbi:MAG: FAD-dependent oxidoreductase [archaeon]
MYNAAILGGGPAGYSCAIRIAQLGGKAVIVEKDEIGGTCLNRGCIPTKALISSVNALDSAKQAKRLGVNIEGAAADYARIFQHKETVVRSMRAGLSRLLESYGIEVIKGKGKIESGSVVAGNRVIRAESAVIATGSEPVVPENLKGALTSDAVLSLKEQPESMVIIGGGVIGAEFATIFSRLGTRVTIIEMLPRLIAGEDEDVSGLLEKTLLRLGVDILTDARVLSVGDAVVAEKDGRQTEINAAVVLCAIGRRPAGFEGKVNGRMQVKPNLYAVGDAAGGMMLAHVAYAEGIVAAENIMGKKSVMDYSAVPNCIFTIPEIASVGLRPGKGTATGRFDYAALGRARCAGEIEGFCKAVVKNGRVAGLHIIGAHATDLIGQGVIAVQQGMGVKSFERIMQAHPTFGEAVGEAILDSVGRAIHLPRK